MILSVPSGSRSVCAFVGDDELLNDRVLVKLNPISEELLGRMLFVKQRLHLSLRDWAKLSASHGRRK
jgi:hypothetical protein